MQKTLFITGSGTGVGKTLVTSALAHQLKAAGRSVSALKPVISGYREDDPQNDVARLLRSQNLPVNRPNIEAIAPWRFAAPLSPDIAAAREGRVLPYGELLDFCRLPRTSEVTLIEGAGGVMSPLTHNETMLDWIAALGCPAILVAGTYLGAISHALTAAHALASRGVALQAVVVSETSPLPDPLPQAGEGMGVQETASALKRFVPAARYVVPLPRVAGEGDLWQHVADLSWILT